MKAFELTCSVCLLSLPVLLFLGGCVGYRLGSTLPDGIDSVALVPVVNTTAEPGLEMAVTRAMRSFIQFDGRLDLTSPDQADALIEITLTGYRSRPIAYDEDTTAVKPLDYRQRISASAVLRDKHSDKALRKADNYGESIFAFDSDLSTSKRSAVPAAAEELARLLYTDLFESW